MTPIIIVALEHLTARINLTTGLLHPADESYAKELFKCLHLEGERLEKSEITEWANRHGWDNKHANHLGDLGQRIGSGLSVRNSSMKHKHSEIMARLKKRLEH